MKEIEVKVPPFGMAIAISQRSWGDKVAANNNINSLFDHILDHIKKALMFQQQQAVVFEPPSTSYQNGPISINKDNTREWKGTPGYQLMFMKFLFNGHEGTIMAVLIPTMGNEKKIEYAASILLEEYIYFEMIARQYSLDPNKMLYDESIGYLVNDLDHPILRHIRCQVDKSENDPIKAVIENRLLMDQDTLESIKKNMDNSDTLFGR